MKYWLARENDLYSEPEQADAYLLSPDKPVVSYEQERDGKKGHGWASHHDCRGWIHIPARVWHRLGGLELKPGEGPIRIEVSSVRWRYAKKKAHR